jgi:hypothetical protein
VGSVGTYIFAIQYTICVHTSTAFLQFVCVKSVKIMCFTGCILSIRESYQKVEFIKLEGAQGFCFVQCHKVWCSIIFIVMDRVSYSFIVWEYVSKVKFVLEQATKAQRGSKGQALFFL